MKTQNSLLHRIAVKLSMAILGILSITLAFAASSTLSRPDESIGQLMEPLDSAFQQLMYDTLVNTPTKKTDHSSNTSLVVRFKELHQENPQAAYQLVLKNITLFVENISSEANISIVKTLLDSNQLWLAERIYAGVETQNDNIALSILDFHFARYFQKIGRWQGVRQLTSNNLNALTTIETDFAYLLQGTANQQLKNHRESINNYSNIARSSPYYIYAQLNTALANIRQGWLTDARIILDQLIESNLQGNSDLLNRTHLILAYALLQKEYYRDARSHFEQIEINSQYFTRALMGLSLTAISQGDYITGLKTIDQLKKNNANDLSSDEAYLVLPYIYEKLEQPLEIVEGFEVAIDHFQNRLLELNQLKNTPVSFDSLSVSSSQKIQIGQFTFDRPNQYLSFALMNRRTLTQLASDQQYAEHHLKLKTLKYDIEQALEDAIKNLITKRSKLIVNYISQARFGLARFYDNQQSKSEE